MCMIHLAQDMDCRYAYCVSHSVCLTLCLLFAHCMVLVYIQLIAILSFAMLVTRFIRFMEIFT